MYGKIIIIHHFHAYKIHTQPCVVAHFMEMCVGVAVNSEKHLCDNHLNCKRIENCIQPALYSGGFFLSGIHIYFTKQPNNGRCFNQKSYQGHRQTAILSMTY